MHRPRRHAILRVAIAEAELALLQKSGGDGAKDLLPPRILWLGRQLASALANIGLDRSGRKRRGQLVEGHGEKLVAIVDVLHRKPGGDQQRHGFGLREGDGLEVVALFYEPAPIVLIDGHAGNLKRVEVA